MAQVFASSHPVLESRVAIKVLKKEACADPHYVARFLEDARAAHGLNQPNIVRVLDVDNSGAQPFIVMELVDGASLDRWLPEHPLEVGEAARIARDVGRALEAAHQAGMVHRDVKPSNILIDRDTGVVKLTDFGAAKRERPGAAQLTEMGQRIGTPRYMAPEQIDGSPVDQRADLFALGATLYELLANKPAFEGATVSAVFHAILFSEPRPLAEVRPDAPAELAGLVDRLLAKAPEDRPASVKEVVAALEPFVSGAAPVPPPGPLTDTEPAPTERTVIRDDGPRVDQAGGVFRKPLVPALVGAAVLILAIGTWWLWSPNESDGRMQSTTAPPGETGQESVPAGPVASGSEESTTTAEGTTTPSSGEAGQESMPGGPVASGSDESTTTVEGTATPPSGEASQESVPGGPVASGSDESTTVAGLTPGEGGEEAPGSVPPPVSEVTPPPPQEPLTALECPAADAPGCVLAADALSTSKTPVSEAPQLTLNRPDGIYLDQEYLVIEAVLPPDLEGYLYLDVLTDAGDVYHLLPEPMREDNQVAAGGKFKVGVEESERAPGVRHWQAAPPFGPGYVLALVSEKPLYPEPRPIEETITDYQDVLLEALADPAIGKKAAQVVRLEFRPRGG